MRRVVILFCLIQVIILTTLYLETWRDTPLEGLEGPGAVVTSKEAEPVGLREFCFVQPGEETGLLPPDASWETEHRDDLDGILERRYLRVLTTLNRTNFYLAGGRPFGFEYSLLKDYEKKVNSSISRKNLQVVTAFIPVPRDQLMPALISGCGDIAAAGLTITPARLKEVDFTEPYLWGIDEVVVTHKKVSDLKSLEDLSGREVFIRASSSYYESLLSLNKSFKEKKLMPVRIVKADETLETEEVLEMVNAGAVDITIADSHLARIWADIFENLKIHENLKVRTGGKIAWMVRKRSPELKASLNNFLGTHKKGTRLGNIYFNRFYKNTKWIKNPLTESERKKLTTYRKYFEKYAAEYGFDWLLLAAVAFQESGLDQNKKSHAGAVGVMQLLPSTAADKNVGIRDIHKPEQNIHAGAKYLAFLRDRYYSGGDVGEEDRVRFVLASYNAGPANVARSRGRASKMGLDDTRWFRHVEMAVLRDVGQEPVQYVTNINKYYVLYKLHFEKRRPPDPEKQAQSPTGPTGFPRLRN